MDRVGQLILISVLLTCASGALGQTGEFQYFYHPQYFNDSLVALKKIKSIEVTNWTHEGKKLYKEQRIIYKFNTTGQLECTDVNYFKPEDSTQITLQTIDCYEYYENGRQQTHRRYHEKSDSASWIETFSYELTKTGKLSKTTTNDLSYPHNSSYKNYFYDGNDNLSSVTYDFGVTEEYLYNDKGQMIREIRLSKDNEKADTTFYTYDNKGNLTKWEFKGTAFDDFDVVLSVSEFDENGNVTRNEFTTADGVKSVNLIKYDKKRIIEYNISNKGRRTGSRTKIYKDGVIQEIIDKTGNRIRSRETFQYQVY
jgi:YD repeat-containing protein